MRKLFLIFILIYSNFLLANEKCTYSLSDENSKKLISQKNIDYLEFEKGLSLVDDSPNQLSINIETTSNKKFPYVNPLRAGHQLLNGVLLYEGILKLELLADEDSELKSQYIEGKFSYYSQPESFDEESYYRGSHNVTRRSLKKIKACKKSYRKQVFKNMRNELLFRKNLKCIESLVKNNSITEADSLLTSLSYAKTDREGLKKNLRDCKKTDVVKTNNDVDVNSVIGLDNEKYLTALLQQKVICKELSIDVRASVLFGVGAQVGAGICETNIGKRWLDLNLGGGTGIGGFGAAVSLEISEGERTKLTRVDLTSKESYVGAHGVTTRGSGADLTYGRQIIGGNKTKYAGLGLCFGGYFSQFRCVMDLHNLKIKVLPLRRKWKRSYRLLDL